MMLLILNNIILFSRNKNFLYHCQKFSQLSGFCDEFVLWSSTKFSLYLYQLKIYFYRFRILHLSSSKIKKKNFFLYQINTSMKKILYRKKLLKKRKNLY